jgi:hypothetical protein
MRALLIGVFGGVVGLVLFGLSRVGGGLLGGGAFVVALFMIPLTTGMVIAALFAAWQESPRPARIHLGQHTSPSRTRERCGSCRRKMTQVGQIWICSVCDGVAVEH